AAEAAVEVAVARGLLHQCSRRRSMTLPGARAESRRGDRRPVPAYLRRLKRRQWSDEAIAVVARWREDRRVAGYDQAHAARVSRVELAAARWGRASQVESRREVDDRSVPRRRQPVELSDRRAGHHGEREKISQLV